VFVVTSFDTLKVSTLPAVNLFDFISISVFVGYGFRL